MKDDLLPCPFCGGEARLEEGRAGGMPDNRDAMWSIYCQGCTARSPWIVNQYFDASNHEPSQRMVRLWWNRRASNNSAGSPAK